MAAIRPGRPAQAAAPAAKKAAGQAAEAPPPPPPPPAPKSRSMTVPAIVVAVALLGAAFMLKGGGGDGGATQATSTPTSEVAAEVEGEVVALDPITMNLAGGDILKVGIALQLKAEHPEAEAALEDPGAFGARALDETIVVLGGYTRSELLRAGGIQDAKAKLSARVAEVYHGDVVAVYITQFVIA